MTDILIADIGGSTTRLALADPGGRPDHIIRFENDDIAGIEAAIEQYLAGRAARPRRAVLARRRPRGGRGDRPHQPQLAFPAATRWRASSASRASTSSTISRRSPGRCPSCARRNSRRSGRRRNRMPAPRSRSGPGTGLGVSALVPNGRDWIAVPTEGGHISFGPAQEDEIAILRSVGGGSLARVGRDGGVGPRARTALSRHESRSAGAAGARRRRRRASGRSGRNRRHRHVRAPVRPFRRRHRARLSGKRLASTSPAASPAGSAPCSTRPCSAAPSRRIRRSRPGSWACRPSWSPTPSRGLLGCAAYAERGE